MSHTELEQLREQVDAVNLQILSLINERASVIQEIGKIKEKQGATKYDPLRERHMLNLLKENNNGPLDQKTVDHIFKEVSEASVLDMVRMPVDLLIVGQELILQLCRFDEPAFNCVIKKR